MHFALFSKDGLESIRLTASNAYNRRRKAEKTVHELVKQFNTTKKVLVFDVDSQKDFTGYKAPLGPQTLLGHVAATEATHGGRFIASLLQKKGIEVLFGRSGDQHPKNHASFIENGGPFSKHCIAKTEGAAFIPHGQQYITELGGVAIDIQKGVNVEHDAFSAGANNEGGMDGFSPLNLTTYLEKNRDIQHIIVFGHVITHCVKRTAEVAHHVLSQHSNASVTVLPEYCGTLGNSTADQAAEWAMEKNGITIVRANSALPKEQKEQIMQSFGEEALLKKGSASMKELGFAYAIQDPENHLATKPIRLIPIPE